MERFKLREINEVGFSVEYDLKISNKYADVENFYDIRIIKSALENIIKVTKLSAKGSLGQVKTAP
jgi:hypothetical protein